MKPKTDKAELKKLCKPEGNPGNLFWQMIQDALALHDKLEQEKDSVVVKRADLQGLVDGFQAWCAKEHFQFLIDIGEVEYERKEIIHTEADKKLQNDDFENNCALSQRIEKLLAQDTPQGKEQNDG